MKNQLLATLLVTMFAVPVIGGAAVNQLDLGPNLPNDIQNTEQERNENVALSANVYAYKNGEKVGEKHNVLMEGEAATVHKLSTGDSHEYETIAVGNGATPSDSSGSLDGRVTDCGFSPTAGNVEAASNGESYNVTHTFTSQCSIDVSTTALEVNTDYGTITDANGNSIDTFAGTSFGRTIPFEPDDQLTIEYKIAPMNP
jgi:hypothetical protein